MYCSSCGKSNPENSNFCKHCGSKIGKVAEPAQESKTEENHSKKIDKSSSTKKKNSYLSWLLWWQVDQDEVDKQVREYDDLDIWHAARKVSALLLIFSAVLTIALVFLFNWESSSLVDAVLMLFVAFFVYRGHKWAMVVAMIYWTFSKVYFLYSAYSSPSASQTNPIVSLIWWATYMHAFYEAFT